MPCVTFCNMLVFMARCCYPPPTQPQGGGPPFVGCPRLLVEYIRRYSSYLEAFSSASSLRVRHGLVTTGWRKLHNEELQSLYSSPNIIRVTKLKMK
jgi:hypothetical protein